MRLTVALSGADLTIDRLQQGGLAFTGTRKRASRAPWSTLTRARGLTVAWLACTYGTNGIPDLHHQVLHCFEDAPELLSEIASLHAEPSIDAVILVPHWASRIQQLSNGASASWPNLPLRLARWRWLAPIRTRCSGGNA